MYKKIRKTLWQALRVVFVFAFILSWEFSAWPSLFSFPPKVPESKAASWYNYAWAFRKSITIDFTKVSTNDQTNFPVLVSVTDADLKNHALSSGNDILFTASDGTTKLDHELEHYSSSVGELEAWVRIPTLSHTVNTVIYMYYGNASSGDQSNKAGVWDSNYAFVLHLPDGTNLGITDSTSHITFSESGSPTAATGKIDGGMTCSSGNRLSGAHGASLDTTRITLSAWVKTSNIGFMSVIDRDNGSTQRVYQFRQDGVSQFPQFIAFVSGAQTVTGNISVHDGNWHYMVGTYDGSTIRLYVDGSQNGTPVSISGNLATSATLEVGVCGSVNNSTYWGGQVDEVRQSGIARSADWISTEYNNQSNPSTFMSFGSEELGVSGTTVSKRSDTLSDSRPSAASNHTFGFTVNAAVTGSSTLTFAFPSSFLLPVGLNCGDVNAVTSSQFNFNYPGCAATATAWGFSAGSSDFTLQAPTDSTSTVHVATGTPISLYIGLNATSTRQGVNTITNPSTAGVYTITLGGTAGNSGNFLVAITGPVTVSATMGEYLALTVSSVAAANCTADDGASVNAIATAATAVPFGTVSANTFYQGCQDLVVSENSINGGYSLAGWENTSLLASSGNTIPDTACDNGLCTAGAASGWATPTNNGFGHTCTNQAGHDCNYIYSSGINFRPFANIALGTNDWYNPAWSYRKRIVIANTSVSSTAGLVNFPVLISRTDTAWETTAFGGHVQSATGSDFVITAGDGVTKLNDEVESYVSSTGAFVAWVQVPFLSTTSTNLLYVYYGNSSQANQQNATGVWDSNYKGVWHLTTTSTQTNLTLDSTANANTGTKVSATDPTTTSAGQVDGAQQFDGTDDNVNIGNMAGANFGTNDFSVSLWFQTSVNTRNEYMFGKRATCGNDSFWNILHKPGGTVDAEIDQDGSGTNYNNIVSNGSINVNDGKWHCVTMVRSGTTLSLYLDGTFSISGSSAGITNISSAANVLLGDSPCASKFTGILDEARISNGIARSSGWIATEYNNQSSPSTFMNFGTEEQPWWGDTTGPVIMASSTPAVAAGRVKFRLSVGSQQPAGVYSNTIDYILTGTF